jgi:hypothetical protein
MKTKHPVVNIVLEQSNNKPLTRLRKETPTEVKKKIRTALADLRAGNTSGFISFSADEFEQFSQSLPISGIEQLSPVRTDSSSGQALGH